MNAVQNLKNGTVTVPIAEFNESMDNVKKQEDNLKAREDVLSEKKKDFTEMLKDKSDIVIAHTYGTHTGMYGESHRHLEVFEKGEVRYAEMKKNADVNLQRRRDELKKAKRGLTIFNAYNRLKNL